jgi:DNA polymerase
MPVTIVDRQGRTLPVVGLDFETYYQKGTGPAFFYTLSKMTTTEYVRHPLFRAHGASIRLPGDERAWWVSHCELRDVLAEVDWKNVALLCQNTAFDGLILSHHFNHIPAYYLDTLSMSRGHWGVHVPHSLGQIGERLGLGGKIEGALAQTANIYRLSWEQEKPFLLYGNRDVDLMTDIFHKLYYDEGYPEKELHIIDLTIRAYCDPRLKVNRALCLEELNEEMKKESKLVQATGVDPEVLSSNLKFAALLKSYGVEPPTKISARTNKETFAFAKADLDFQELEKNPRVAHLVRARKAVKSTIGKSRALRLMAHGSPALPIMMNYCQAHTHRWTGGDKMNPHNLPAARGGNPARLRRSIEAPDGWVLVVVDSSQIEPRTNAWVAGEQGLLSEFANDLDPYSRVAEDIYGYPVNKKDNPEERFLGKKVELGAGYGMGWSKFQHTVRADEFTPMNISDELAQRAIMTYRRKRAAIPALWRQLDDALLRMFKGESGFEIGPWTFYPNAVRLPNDLFMFYPHLIADEGEYGLDNFRYESRNGWTNIYGGKLDENLIQSTARTIVAYQALEIALRYHIVLLVHDEVVYLARENEADEALKYGIHCLSTAPKGFEGLPVAAEGGHAKNYSK